MTLAACWQSVAGASPDAVPEVWHVGPTPAVRAICHTRGVVWIGTAAGLFLIDIRNGNTLGYTGVGARLPSSSVRAIAAKGDSVFVGTDAGLALFRRDATSSGYETTVFTPASPGPLAAVPLSRVVGLGVGANGDVLLATSGRGAGVITAAGGYSVTRRDSLIDDKVFAVADRADGTRYFATSVGLCAQVNDTTIVSFQAGAGIPRGEVRALVPAGRNAFYLLIANHGVFRFDGARAVEIESPGEVSLRDAAAISAGSDGTLWAAGDGWVFARRAGKWARAALPAIDAGARWRVIVADGAGAFVGSNDGRVVAISRGSAFRVALPGGLPAPRVQSLAPDGTGGAWFVCDGRLVHADAEARSFRVENEPRDVRAIAVAPSGEVWTAGRWTVRRRAADAWIDVRPDVVGADPAYTALVVDEMGAWVGTRTGALYRYDGGMWLRISRAPRPTGGAVATIGAADNGAWAVAGGRPARSRDGGWKRFAGIDSATAVVDLAQGPGGRWIAATADRIYAFDESQGTWAPESKGAAPRGRIRALAFDARGRLVLGTTEGVGLVGPTGVRWLTAAEGLGGGAVADVAVDGDRLWVGFAEDGFSVIVLVELW